jgi:hypothetical protein
MREIISQAGVTLRKTSAFPSMQVAAALLAPAMAATCKADHPLLLWWSHMVRVAPRRPCMKSEMPSLSFSSAFACIVFHDPVENSSLEAGWFCALLLSFDKNSIVLIHSASFPSLSRDILSSILVARSYGLFD